MTRKDFIFITDMFRECLDLALTDHDKIIIEGVVMHFAAGLREVNPRFDVMKFLDATEDRPQDTSRADAFYDAGRWDAENGRIYGAIRRATDEMQYDAGFADGGG